MQAILEKDKDTICALSTPSGRGGIAVIRVSGTKAEALTRSLCPSLPKALETHKVYFTRLFSFELGELIDEVLLTYFKEGKSFTGEHTIEISCHGSPYLTQRIVNDLVLAGCRHAEKGEFTYRAFLNNKIDLIQAESVLNLIESQSERTANQAIRQLQGELSKQVGVIEEELLLVGAYLEAQIDFVEQDIDPKDELFLIDKLEKVTGIVSSLLRSFKSGRLLKEGYQVVLAGEPNVGKSSLLNKILTEDKAIVTEYAGTTRDVVEGSKILNGLEVKYFDTAGIHESEDLIEKLGIKKSTETIFKSDLVFFVVDSLNLKLPKLPLENTEEKIIAVVFNKRDKIQNEEDFAIEKNNFLSVVRKEFQLEDEVNSFEVSALTGEGVSSLDKFVSDQIKGDINDNSMVVVSSRQFEILKNILDEVKKALGLLKIKESPEFISFEIKAAVVNTHKLLGKEYDDQIVDKVFSEFCLGK